MILTDEQIARARSCPLGYAQLLPTPTGKFLLAPHLVMLNEALLECYYGPKKRLVVSMPPGHSKSTTVSRAGMGWHIGTYPHKVLGLGSYEGTFAKTWGRAVRDDIGEMGDAIWGVRVSGDSNAADRWDLVGHTGGMRTAGIEGRLTGMRLHGIVVDDPIKDAAQAHSKTYRDACFAWMQSVVEGRLEPDAWIVIVMTRWHEDDLVGRLLKEQPGEWDVLNLPALARANDPLGREIGAALWPARYNESAMAKKKKRVGTYWFDAQFQGRPNPEAGNKVRREWFKYFDARPLQFDRIITSTDCSFKDTEGTSFVVMQAWGQKGADAYLLDQIRARMDFPETCANFREFHSPKRWGRAGSKLVEDKANGPAVISSFKKIIPGILPIEVSGKGSKVARFSVVTPFFESRNIFVPNPQVFGWVTDYIEELVSFPNADNDDQVDATSQALEHFFGAASLSIGTEEGDGEPGKKPGKRPKRVSGERAESEEPNDVGGGSVGRLDLWRG